MPFNNDAVLWQVFGDPNAAHMDIGNAPDGHEGARLYAPDGHTVLIDLDAKNGLASLSQVTIGVGSTVPGGSVVGAVASATNATNATNAVNATNALNVTGTVSINSSNGLERIQIGSTTLFGGHMAMVASDIASGKGGYFGMVANPYGAGIFVNGTGVFANSAIGMYATQEASDGSVDVYLGDASPGTISRVHATSTVTLNLVTQPQAMSGFIGGPSVGSPAPKWIRDIAGNVHLYGTINLGAVTNGTVITPTTNPPPANNYSGHSGGRFVVSTDVGPAEMFVGSGMQVFNLPAGATKMWFDGLTYYSPI